MTTYGDEEIESSKKKLFDLCADESTSRRKVRKGPRKNKQNLEDMIKLLQEKGSDVPVFVARDLSKLPPVNFDSVVFTETNKKTRDDVEMLKECIGTQNSAFDSLRKVVTDVESRVKHLERDNDQTSVKVVDGPSSTAASDTTPGPTAIDQRPSNRTYAQQVSSGPSESGSVAGSKVDTWSTVTRVNGRIKKVCEGTQIQPRPQKPKGITGNVKDSGLQTVPKQVRIRVASIFATRFGPNVTSIDLEGYLRGKLNLDLKVERVATRYNTYASFHVTCECPDPSVFMTDDLWPESTFVRWWREPKPTQARGYQVLAARSGTIPVIL